MKVSREPILEVADITMPMIVMVFSLILTALSLSMAPAAYAGICGDDVDGTRVPCACGDVVVSDTRVQRSDPIVHGPCHRDGLIVKAAQGTESVTVDLAGFAIIGRGSGTGIRILDGGAQGAFLIGGAEGAPGQIAGFRVGVSARGARGLKAAENLIVSGNEDDGLRVSGRGATLRGIVADENGGKGLTLHGRDHAVDGVAARGNGRHDIRVSGNGHLVAADEMTRAQGHTRVTGRGNAVLASEAVR